MSGVNEILKSIADFGFPIVVAIYLLVVFGAKLDKLSDSVDRLSHFIEGLRR
ncbi:MAG: YvrJ family protein [Caldisericaceae bacterium]